MLLRRNLEFSITSAILSFWCAVLGSTPMEMQDEDFRTILKNSYIPSTVYERPTQSQLSTAQDLFQRLLETRSFDFNEEAMWASIGLFIRRVGEGGMQFAVISEPQPTAGKGHGFYAINLAWNASAGVKFLQAPHRPSDLGTYEIVAELFTTGAGHYLAAAWSTTHRDIVDLGKETSSFFNAFTIAAAKSSVQPPHIVQLHGFAKSNYNNTEADLIHSSTKVPASPLPDFDRLYNCLKTSLGCLGPSASWGFNVFKYPDEINILGGTLNINAQHFYNWTTTGLFYHIETSKELRDLLIARPDALQLFGRCLQFK